MVRAVVDTNVLVSALINRRKPRTLILKLLEKHTVILSHQMLAELADVLTRDKFLLKTSQINTFLANLARKSKIVKSKIVTPTSRFRIIPEDPDDDTVLNTAYTGKAEYIVTGDKHLLALKEFKRTKIVTVTQMLENLR